MLARTGEPAQTGTGTVFVTLLDVNDNAPVFADDYRPVVYENQPSSRSVITLSAVDRDGPTNGPPFEFWLPCHGVCCDENPTCQDFDFTFIPRETCTSHNVAAHCSPARSGTVSSTVDCNYSSVILFRFRT